MDNTYSQALTEVNSILEYSSQEINRRIPLKFREFIIHNMDKNYIFNVQIGKSLEEQNLKKETRYILALIYRDYLTTEEKRKILIKNELQIKKEIEEKYSVENIFRKKNINENSTVKVNSPNANISLVEYKKIKWYKKMFYRIIEIFKHR